MFFPKPKLTEAEWRNFIDDERIANNRAYYVSHKERIFLLCNECNMSIDFLFEINTSSCAILLTGDFSVLKKLAATPGINLADIFKSNNLSLITQVLHNPDGVIEFVLGGRGSIQDFVTMPDLERMPLLHHVSNDSCSPCALL